MQNEIIAERRNLLGDNFVLSELISETDYLLLDAKQPIGQQRANSNDIANDQT